MNRLTGHWTHGWTHRLAIALLAWAASCSAALAQLPPDAPARAAALASESARALAPKGARVEAEAGTLDPRLVLAACARFDAYLPPGVPAWGRSRIGLRCSEGPVRWNVFLPVQVRVWAPAVLTAVSLPAGARIAASQLGHGEADWAAVGALPFVDADALVGRTLVRTVAAGQALRASDLQPRRWFDTGETVLVVAGGSGFSISAEGQALTPGVEGQAVRVRVGRTAAEEGRVLSGRAIGERRVEVGP